ncbi:MAG: hypothetical protein GEU94_09365 [Micromonosporaceae bacterium]|nr:hypothetical protein [Micromonosporaceae bacterium]
MTKAPDPGQDTASVIAADTAAQLKQAEARVAHMEGQVEAFRAQVATLEATDEHRRGELAVAQEEAADAQATARELRARLEERLHLVEELRDRLKTAKDDKARAEQERAAVIASLGWRAKRRLNDTTDQA